MTGMIELGSGWVISFSALRSHSGIRAISAGATCAASLRPPCVVLVLQYDPVHSFSRHGIKSVVMSLDEARQARAQLDMAIQLLDGPAPAPVRRIGQV